MRILNDSKILASKSEMIADRLLALKFLGHWVGDIHQPLHVPFEDDRGGNNITVSGECSGKLHSTWDTCLVEDAVGADFAAATTELIDGITPEMITKWSASDPRDWANESFAIAEAVKGTPSFAYAMLWNVDGRGWYGDDQRHCAERALRGSTWQN